MAKYDELCSRLREYALYLCVRYFQGSSLEAQITVKYYFLPQPNYTKTSYVTVSIEPCVPQRSLIEEALKIKLDELNQVYGFWSGNFVISYPDGTEMVDAYSKYAKSNGY